MFSTINKQDHVCLTQGQQKCQTYQLHTNSKVEPKTTKNLGENNRLDLLLQIQKNLEKNHFCLPSLSNLTNGPAHTPTQSRHLQPSTNLFLTDLATIAYSFFVNHGFSLHIYYLHWSFLASCRIIESFRCHSSHTQTLQLF